MTRMIYVSGAEKSVPLRIYIEGVKAAKANPKATFKHGLTSWWPTTGEEIMGQFRDGMMDRINQRIPYSRRGLP